MRKLSSGAFTVLLQLEDTITEGKEVKAVKGDTPAKILTVIFLGLSLLFGEELIAYYNPDCGCCHRYFTLLEKKGLKIKRVEVSYEELQRKKEELGIPLNKRSCHTMVVKGKFIEGHVPLEGIKALLRSEARGVYSPHGIASGMGREEGYYELIY